MSGAVHGTAVAIDGWGVLLTGKSGAGKSDIALRLIDRGAELVADDYVEINAELSLSAPAALAGKIEVRGVGICNRLFAPHTALRLLVELGEDGERLPSSPPLTDFQGWSLPHLRLNGFSASAPIKVELALKSVVDGGLLPVRLLVD